MQVFVSEYICGGGWPAGTVAGSLAVEGRAMLCAIVEDLSRIPGVRVVTTWDGRLGPPPFSCARTVCVESPDGEFSAFQRLAGECDATLLIAPEFDGILLERSRIVEKSGGRLLGPPSRAIALCTDKLRLATHLHDAGIPTIPTWLLDLTAGMSSATTGDMAQFPIVVKPRDGAGSQKTWLVRDASELERIADELRAASATREFIRQPYIAGRAASVALVFSPSRREVEILVPAEQRLSGDGRLRYEGGRVPLRNIDGEQIQSAALAACRSVPGMRGYVGVDLVLPDNDRGRPLVVEINPRLTTSYLGYRALSENNLAEWMLLPGRFERGIRWRKTAVEFDASGHELAANR
jgi:predicted ATP-grasp superfamily ATP-dependent carboligase